MGITKNFSNFGQEKVVKDNIKSISKEDKIIKLLEENLAISKEVLFQGKRTVSWIYWQKVKGWFYTILIIAPLVLAFIYLPPMLEDFYEQYQKIWRMLTTVEAGKEYIQLTPEQLQQIKNLQDAGIIK